MPEDFSANIFIDEFFYARMNKYLIAFVILVALIVLCGGIFIFGMRGNKSADDYSDTGASTVKKNLLYSSGREETQTLDFYQAYANSSRKQFIVVIHGGGWEGGDKKGFSELAQWFHSEGFAVANINYRLSPNGHYPEQISDVLEALRFLEREYGAKEFILFGHSAGAHLALLSALAQNNPLALEINADYPDSRIVGAIGVSGPYDYHLLRGSPNEMYSSFAQNYFEEANVIRHADSSDTLRILLLAGAEDNFVPWKNSEALAGALPSEEYFLIDGYGHNDIIRPFDTQKPAFQKIQNFLSEF